MFIQQRMWNNIQPNLQAVGKENVRLHNIAMFGGQLLP